MEAKGRLKYCDNHKLIVEIDNDFASYYRSLIPKWVAKPNKQRYDTHITVIRNEIPTNLECWLKYNGKEIIFTYSPDIQTDGVYFWLNVYSTELEEIREELGLEKSSEWSRPPDNTECFHITIGNLK